MKYNVRIMRIFFLCFTVAALLLGISTIMSTVHASEVQGAPDVNAYDSEEFLTFQLNGDQGSYTVLGRDKAVSGRVEIPSEFNGKPVTAIGEKAFQYFYYLTDIVIPDSITEIGGSAFSDCHSLTEIVIPDSVVSIGNQAFYGCSKMERVVLPAGLTGIGKGVFQRCCRLRSIEIPQGVTEISEYAFHDCYSLTSISIPEAVTYIGSAAFLGCTGLQELTIPDSVEKMGSSTFENCSGITEVIIPDLMTSIGSYTFSGCTGLQRIVIGNKVSAIGDYAFSDCYELTELQIPDSVRKIGKFAFSNCSGLTNVTFGKGVSHIGSGSFSGCTGLTEVVFSDSLDTIQPEAFRNCTSLAVVAIPEAFKKIMNNAFLGCDNLWHILYGGNEQQWKTAFIDSSNTLLSERTLHFDAFADTELDPVNKTCSICQNQCAHIWDAGTTKREASCSQEGIMSYSCTVCATIKTEMMAKLAHTPGPAATATTPQKCTVCGFELAPALKPKETKAPHNTEEVPPSEPVLTWIAVVALVAMAATFIADQWKKRRKQE